MNVAQAPTSNGSPRLATSGEVAAVCANLLEAIGRTGWPKNRQTVVQRLVDPASMLAYANSTTNGFGLVKNPAGIGWRLDDGDPASYVYLFLPTYTVHAIRPRWDGQAQVVLAGDATEEDAVTLITGLTAQLPE